MSKDLKALCNLYARASVHCPIDEIGIIVDEFYIIKNTLKDYQTLKREYDFGVEHYNELLNDYNKEHKALEIIKEKEVNVYILQWYFKHSSYEQYADDFERNRRDCDLPDLGDRLLTKEEFDLLKEALL